MRNPKTFCFGLAAAFVLASAPALAQVYSWKDPATGQSRFSNIAPRWYSRGEVVSGLRVIATIGRKVIDDTALPYEDRLLLSGKAAGYIDWLRPQRLQRSAAAQAQNREPARAPAADKPVADKSASRGATVSGEGS